MDKPLIFDCNFNEYLAEFQRYTQIIENFLFNEFYKANKNWKFKEPKTKKEITKFLNLSRQAREHIMFYPQSFRTSIIVQLFSVFEKDIKDICLYHHHYHKTDFSIKDLRGNSDIQRAKLYLKKTCYINFKKLEPEWSFIETIRKVRNIIIHYQCKINKSHNDWNSIYKFIDKNKNLLGYSECIEYSEKDQLKELFDNEYYFNLEIQNSKLTEEFIKVLRSFFNKLISEIKFE